MSAAATSRFRAATIKPATSRCKAALSAGGAGCRRGDALSDIYLVIQWTAAAVIILGFGCSAKPAPLSASGGPKGEPAATAAAAGTRQRGGHAWTSATHCRAGN